MKLTNEWYAFYEAQLGDVIAEIEAIQAVEDKTPELELEENKLHNRMASIIATLEGRN